MIESKQGIKIYSRGVNIEKFLRVFAGFLSAPPEGSDKDLSILIIIST